MVSTYQEVGGVQPAFRDPYPISDLPYMNQFPSSDNVKGNVV